MAVIHKLGENMYISFLDEKEEEFVRISVKSVIISECCKDLLSFKSFKFTNIKLLGIKDDCKDASIKTRVETLTHNA